MFISYEWLRDYTETQLSPDEIKKFQEELSVLTRMRDSNRQKR